ncbi:hypothetical protein PGT21_030336 [Puccinia graminis f. sp. tritici]|uniref:Secreted protein n=1 Tax=Puccinia graminis f. sp. tritici TaxID=56615 RepID=A0A5B0NBA8_PUCGR|nr:hypothetical protein PGTUg99_010427 [Puccinia graminis f. sp. tritici]KAA1104711.1 hypothetical protein PGT21_030336 [Puccinia graminis f. sp. tritici]
MQFSKIFPIFMALLIPHVQAWGCKDNPTVAGFPWSACLKSNPDYQSVDLIDAPWRGAGGYDCTMDDKGHMIPTCCSKHEEDMPKTLSKETLLQDCKHLDGSPFEWPPKQHNW